MARRSLVPLIPALLVVFSAAAHAQTPPLLLVEDTDYLEFGGELGIMNYAGTPLWGGHVTRNVTRWLAGEVAVHAARAHEGPLPLERFGTVTADVRIGGRLPIAGGAPDFLMVFGTVGAARAYGLSYRYSPVVGFGVQGRPEPGLPLGWRVDFQRLTNGWALNGGVRMTFGIVIVP